MPYRDSQAARRALHRAAARQGGYFTAKQARAAGYSKQHVAYHASVGNFERVERGLFRLPTLPPGDHDDLIRLALWSRGRDDVPQAVVSHRTALALHELGDLFSGRVHLTVPPEFRKEPPASCVLHRGQISARERARWEGFEVTTPLRTLADVARDDGIPFEQLVRAVEDAVERGLATERQLERAADALGPGSRLVEALAARDAAR